jgi:hypothetical protein
MKRGLLEGMVLEQELGFPTEKEVKRQIAYLLKQDNVADIGIRLNKSACVSDLTTV